MDLIQAFHPHFLFVQSLCYHQIPHTQHGIGFLAINLTYTTPWSPSPADVHRRISNNLSEHHPALSPLSPDTQQMASVQPQVPSAGPGLLRSMDLPHCHTHSSGRQLASYQGKWKHTLLHTHSSPGSARGGKKKNVPAALIGQLTLSYVWNFFIWTQLEIFKWACVMPGLSNLNWEVGIFSSILSLSGEFGVGGSLGDFFCLWKNTNIVCSLTSTQGLNMSSPVTQEQALNLTANLEITLLIVVVQFKYLPIECKKKGSTDTTVFS